MSANTQALFLGTAALTTSTSAVRCSNGLGCLVTPLYRRHTSAVSHLPSRGTFLIQCCSDRIPRRPSPHQKVKQQEGVRERLDGSRQCAQEDKLHTFWLQVPGLLTGVLFAMALLVAPSAQASWIRKRKPEPQPAQVDTARGWLAPAAASMESARHRARRAAHAADKNVLQPALQQTQHTAAGTKRWLESMVGSQERSAKEPRSENMTIEEHLQQSMESPAVRILVTVGAVSVLLLLVRTSMEESSTKKFSPMDSDDWTDDRDVPELEEGGEAGYPRSPATFTGSAAQAAATLAARADAIADKADDMRGARRPAPPDIILMQDPPDPEPALGAAPPPAPRAAASAAHAASPAQLPAAEGLPNVEAVQPSVQPEPKLIEPVGLPEPVPVQPAEMPAPKPVEAFAVEPPKPMAPSEPVEASAVEPPKPMASPLSSAASSGSAQSVQSRKDPAIKEVLPAGTLEAFASNRKLREQLEEVRITVAQAKAQVDAAGSTSNTQGEEARSQHASRLQERQQPPVSKTTALEGSAVDYQAPSTPAPPIARTGLAPESARRSTTAEPAPGTSPSRPERPSFGPSQAPSTPAPPTARTGLAPESARRSVVAEPAPGTSPSRPERPSFGTSQAPSTPAPPIARTGLAPESARRSTTAEPAPGTSPSRPERPSFGTSQAPSTSAPAVAHTGLAPESARRSFTAEPAPGTSPSRPERPSFGPPPTPPPTVGTSPSGPPRPSFGPPSAPPAAVETTPSRAPRPSFGPPSQPPPSERRAPIVRYETSQGEPVKPPRPTQNGGGAFRLPWQSKGEKKTPLPSPPQPTSPARAVSIATEPATRDGKREARALGQQVKESEAFLRRRGSEAPAVVALSFLSAAAAALAPLVMDKEERERRTREAQQRRQRWRQLSAEEKELDWQRYGKYDALQQLLQSAAEDPSFKASDRSPAKTIVSAVPKKGRPKYDFLRQLAHDLVTSRHGPEHTDPVWNLLHMAKEKHAPMRASNTPNPVFEWLNRAAAAADWGLPEAGPAAALLRLDASDWEPPGYCPVYDVLKSARAGGPAPWHNNIRSSQDPLTGLFSLQRNPPKGTLIMQAPSGISKFDPLPHAVRAQAPALRSQSDPFARLLDHFHSRISAKGDVPQLPNILPGEPPRPASTPVAALTEAADAIQGTADSPSGAATPANPGGSSATLDQPAAASTASAMTQQAALRAGAGSVTSQRGQGWLRAMWNRSTGGKPKQSPAASQKGSAGAMPGATRVNAARPTVKPLQPSAAEAQTRSLAQALQSAQQAMRETRQSANGAPKQARQGADRVPTEGHQQGTSPTSSQALQAAAPKLARQGAYNPLPDLLRLERGMDTPIGSACDHISIMLRRDSDFGPVAAAFKELVADERLQKDYWPLYTLLRRAAAAPLLAFPGNDEEATLEGLNEVTVGEARKTAKGFVAALDTPRYKALHGLLSNRRSIDIVEAACAMAIIVQPFQKA